MQNKNNLFRFLVNLILPFVLCTPIVTTNFIEKGRKCEIEGDASQRLICHQINMEDPKDIITTINHFQKAFDSYKKAFELYLEDYNQYNMERSFKWSNRKRNIVDMYQFLFDGVARKLSLATKRHKGLVSKLSQFGSYKKQVKKYNDDLIEKYNTTIKAFTSCAITQENILQLCCNRFNLNYSKKLILQTPKFMQKNQLKELDYVHKFQLSDTLQQCGFAIANIGLIHDTFSSSQLAIKRYSHAFVYQKKAYTILKNALELDNAKELVASYINILDIAKKIVTIYLNEKKTSLALKVCRKCISLLELKGPINLYREAEAYKNNGEYEKAIEKYEQEAARYNQFFDFHGMRVPNWYQLLLNDISLQISECTYFMYENEAIKLIKIAQEQYNLNAKNKNCIKPNINLLIKPYKGAIQKYEKVKNTIDNQQNKYWIQANRAIQMLNTTIEKIEEGANSYSIK